MQWRSQNPVKLRTSKGDYWIKQQFSSIEPLFKIGTSLKEQFLKVWKIALITLGDLP